MARVCVDACFLIGLYDKDDPFHGPAIRQFSALFGSSAAGHRLVAPWPILYECLGTRYARDPRKAAILNQHWNLLKLTRRLVLVDDQPFRKQSLSEHLEDRQRALSLVDRVIRAMIVSRRSLFDVFLTYNAGDFADACRKRGITLLNEKSDPAAYGVH